MTNLVVFIVYFSLETFFVQVVACSGSSNHPLQTLKKKNKSFKNLSQPSPSIDPPKPQGSSEDELVLGMEPQAVQVQEPFQVLHNLTHPTFSQVLFSRCCDIGDLLDTQCNSTALAAKVRVRVERLKRQGSSRTMVFCAKK